MGRGVGESGTFSYSVGENREREGEGKVKGIVWRDVHPLFVDKQ